DEVGRRSLRARAAERGAGKSGCAARAPARLAPAARAPRSGAQQKGRQPARRTAPRSAGVFGANSRSTGGSVLLVLRLDNFGRDTATIGDGVTVFPRPRANGLVLLAVDRRGLARRRRACGALTATRTTRVVHILRERVAQVVCILGRQVDLVGHPVHAELDGLVGIRAVHTVDERDQHLLRHSFPPGVMLRLNDQTSVHATARQDKSLIPAFYGRRKQYLMWGGIPRAPS